MKDPEPYDEELRVPTTCPLCGGGDVYEVDLLTWGVAPLPEIASIECAKCKHYGAAVHYQGVWHIQWHGQADYDPPFRIE